MPLERTTTFISDLKKEKALQDENQVGSLRWYLKWYEERYPSARRKYRWSGVAIILLTFLIGAKWHESSVLSLAAIAAIGVAFLSLHSFFGWGTAWRAYYLAKVRIEFALQKYESNLIFAQTISDDDKALSEIYAAYSSLLKTTGEAIEEEGKTYFDGLKSPSPKSD